jgi:hypothetical protein
MEVTVKKPETIQEFQKSQLIRLIDVFAIGPAMVYAGTFKQLPMWLRVFMIGTGVATILYNGKNYILNKNSSDNNSPQK